MPPSPRSDWIGATWLEVLDGLDLAEMFDHASAHRRIVQPRSAIATLVFERMRHHFPEQARPLNPQRPADQPATRMAA